MIILSVLLIIAIQSVISSSADDLLISLPDGQVQGTTYTTDNNKTFYGFQGIPFAAPPIGNLRFEAPRPPQPWTGVWNATKDSNACLSSVNFMYKDIESEDCLYISVYTPSLKPAEKLTVMVWIYGGGFVVGSNRRKEYGADFLLEEDVIVVQFNYRLGPFGFLSTGDSAIVGNAALKDQALAIKWAYDNIQYFGGDPEKITIFGESGGGASSGLQLVSKKATGYYRAAIVQSGSALTNFSIDLDPKAYADILTTALGGEIYLNDTQQMKKFLLEKSAEEILSAANLKTPTYGKTLSDVEPSTYLPTNQPWPVVEVENEDAFLTESPYELLDSGRFNQVPIIIGMCANEGLLFLENLEQTKQTGLMLDTFPDTLIPRDLRQNSSDNDAVVKIIQSLYLKESETFSNSYRALTDYFSSRWMSRGIIKHAELASKYVPVYLYQFSYFGRPLFPFVLPGVEKATHGGELAFLMKTSKSNTTDPADILTQNRIVRLWANFAKYLNPTPEKTELIDVEWPVTTATGLEFLNINATLEVRSPIRGVTYTGWSQIYETYGKKPLITY